MTALHFEPRPWTSPCALCGAEIPLDQTLTLANEDRDAVCDDCAARLDPNAARALKVVRQADDEWWETVGSEPTDPRRLGDAGEYLRHLAAGVAALVEFYDPERPVDPHVLSAERPWSPHDAAG